MALVVKDRVLETSNTNGTGTFTLAGAVNGFQAFSVIGVGNTTYYAITEETNNQWEVGLGTVGSGTLTRDTVLSSSNGGSKVDFADGLKQVFCDYPANKAVYLDASGNVSSLGTITSGVWNGSTIPVANGGTGVTTSSGANSVVLRDANANITTNCLFEGFTTQAASGTTIVLVASSVQNWQITGSGGQIIRLPDATTLPSGATFTFNNNQSSGAITVQNNSSTTVATINSGGYVTVVLLSNSIAAGSWDRHDSTPSNVSWSTNTLDYAGSITSATWNGNVVQVNRGGTGANTLTGYVKGSGTTALTASSTIPNTDISGLGTMSTQNASSVAITGGTIDNTVIGGTTPAAGTFTTITGQTEVLKGSGENLLTYSSVLTNGVWTQSAITVTGSQTDPFGGTTGALLNDGTSNAIHQIQQAGTNYVTGVVYTLSLYAKAGTSNYIGLYHNSQGAIFNLTTGAFTGNIVGAPISYASTNTGLPTGWWRISIVVNGSAGANTQIVMSEDGTNYSFTGTSQTVTIASPQVEMGSTLNSYNATTSAIVYGTPNLSFRGVTSIGLESNGSLYVSPAGTGALQAQATTSSTVGGNARGANAVDWQTTRGSADKVASGSISNVLGGYGNKSSAYSSSISAGVNNTNAGLYGFIGNGNNNNIGGSEYGVIVGGYYNTANGQWNFIGGGAYNSGTSSTAVTNQAATANATTAITLSGSNASIKVGQYISGTYISENTYVSAISGTSLTLSQNASGSGATTLYFYTPHGVVVGGGNNQATGSYSFIGGGGDAGTSGNRNSVASDWGVVVGGFKNTVSATGTCNTIVGGYGNSISTSQYGSFIGGGGTYNGGSNPNTITNSAAVIVGGIQNSNSSFVGFIGGGYANTANGGNYSTIVGGQQNTSNASYSFVSAGYYGTTRGIEGNHVFPACNVPIASASGVSQTALLVLGVQTTDATATVLRSNTSAASGTNQVILPNNSAYYFKGAVIAGVTGAGDTKGWSIEGVIKRGAGVGTTALVGTPTVTSMYADLGAATWAVTATADTTNGGLKITVTGQASTTIRWVCELDTTEMTY